MTSMMSLVIVRVRAVTMTWSVRTMETGAESSEGSECW